MQEQFYRSAMLLGKEGIQTLGQKKVVVFGVGGVGSYAVEALARGGVGALVLIDNDTIDITNINRQLPATLETVGDYKTQVMQKRISTINPQCQVETKEIYAHEENIGELIPPDADYVLDAIDTVSSKIALAEYTYHNGIPMMSCMGAGNKLDPTQFVVTDLYQTSICPLCRVMRRELKKREIPRLKVVYSTEPPSTPRTEELPPSEQEALSLGRGVSTPASVSFVPPVAGMIAAGEIICDLLSITRNPS